MLQTTRVGPSTANAAPDIRLLDHCGRPAPIAWESVQTVLENTQQSMPAQLSLQKFEALIISEDRRGAGLSNNAKFGTKGPLTRLLQIGGMLVRGAARSHAYSIRLSILACTAALSAQ